MSPSPNKWHKQQAIVILADAKKRYGAGWDLLSAEQRQNYLDASVLRLVLAQAGSQFVAAQTMAQGVMRSLAPSDDDEHALSAAAQAGYELKENSAVNAGFYFVPVGDRDDAPVTHPTIFQAWEGVCIRDGIEQHPSFRMTR